MCKNDLITDAITTESHCKDEFKDHEKNEVSLPMKAGSSLAATFCTCIINQDYTAAQGAVHSHINFLLTQATLLYLG